MNVHEADCWRRMSDCRRYFGLPEFVWNAELHHSAYQWASRMATDNRLAHSDMRALLYSHQRNWRRVGENVGVGGAVVSVFDAWVHSPPHFKNLLDSGFNHAACAAVEAGGTLWLVQQFAHIR